MGKVKYLLETQTLSSEEETLPLEETISFLAALRSYCI